MLTISEQDIKYGVQKVINFAIVNQSRSRKEKVDSLNLLASSVGLGGPNFDFLIDFIRKYYEDEGPIIVGILIGLFMTERLLDKVQ